MHGFQSARRAELLSIVARLSEAKIVVTHGSDDLSYLIFKQSVMG